jgi:hypothetical protein
MSENTKPDKRDPSSGGYTHKAIVHSGKPPSQWEVKLFSDIGAGEPFVSRLFIELATVLDAMQVTSADEIKKTDEAKEQLGRLMIDCLMPAFVSLRELRNSDRDDKVPELTKTKHFNDLYGSLWTAYKDRTQKVAKILGFNIAFLYDNDKKFTEGCTKFAVDHPAVDGNFFKMLKWHRDNWQNELSKLRDKWIEHQVLKPEDVKKFYNLKTANAIFDCVWLAIEDIIGFLAGAKLSPSVQLAELPDGNGPTAMKRFCFMWAKGVTFETPSK